MGKLFGTDGIRGVANRELSAPLAFRVGQAAAAVLAREGKGRRPVFTIGKDTRLSSDMLEAALTAGLCSAGADVIPLGVVPTPAVAYITTRCGADAGIVISASHNPFHYNGIKIFNGQGFKLSDALELEIEDLVLAEKTAPAAPEQIGRVREGGEYEVSAYIEHVAAAGKASGLKVLVDCANGAASRTARRIFSRFDVDLELMNDTPNGLNINEHCGSTDMGELRAAVVAGGYDVGVAFDGDADRCLLVDEKGRELDGDQIMAICGKRMRAAGTLKNDMIVATVMSNLGFHRFAEENGIDLRCAAVGDRNVLELMQSAGANLGGEQSGHLIFLDEATTGDGELAAVKMLSLLAAEGKPLSELADEYRRFPQVLLNVPVRDNEAKARIMAAESLRAAIRQAEEELGASGRVLIRPSGTEALIRVMVEAMENGQARALAERLAQVVGTCA